MDDRSLLRTVLIVVLLSLAVNAFTLYEVRAQAAAQEAPPANLFGSLMCPSTCRGQCGGNTDSKCYNDCLCKCSRDRDICNPECRRNTSYLDPDCYKKCLARVCPNG